MDKKEIEDKFLKRNLESLFITNGASTDSPQVLGAMITAASSMALQSEKISKEDTITELLNLYEKSDDKEVNQFIGIGPQYVKPLTGYAVDFNDYSAAHMAYQQQMDLYNNIYDEIEVRLNQKSSEITR